MTNSTESRPIQFRYRSDEVEVNEENTYQDDKLGREPFVKAIVTLVEVIQEPFVIALNSPWGSGKTTTLRLLLPELKTASVTAVSFNAWEVDYATDPLVPLVATLHDKLWEIRGYDRNAVDGAKIDRLKGLAGAVVKHGVVAAVKIATAGILDIEATAQGISKAVDSAAEKAAEGFTGDLIDAFKEERKAANEFRRVLQELIEHVRGENTNGEALPPLILIIDELDRCRPTFSVAMLERIKHFFNVPGLVFILGLDLEQLKASVRKVYGAELDSTEYLRRFVDLELRLPNAPIEEMVQSMLTKCGADAFFESRMGYRALSGDRIWITRTLQDLALNFDLSPRLVQRIITRLMLVIRQTKTNQYLDPILVVFLIFLQTRDELILRGFVEGRLSPAAVMESIRKINPKGEKFYQSDIGILIEAHLLRALRYRSEFLTEFTTRFEALDKQATDPVSSRLKSLASRYERTSDGFSRDSIDLREVDRRINLVATDLVRD